MSLIPFPSSFCGQRSNSFDPFSPDLWDPFKDFSFPSSISASFPELSRKKFRICEHQDWKKTPKSCAFKASSGAKDAEESTYKAMENMHTGGIVCARVKIGRKISPCTRELQ